MNRRGFLKLGSLFAAAKVLPVPQYARDVPDNMNFTASKAVTSNFSQARMDAYIKKKLLEFEPRGMRVFHKKVVIRDVLDLV